MLRNLFRTVRGRGRALALGACLLVALLGSLSAGSAVAQEAAAAPVPAAATWHAITFVRGRHGLRVITYWSKQSWMRAETLIAGHPIVTIVRGPEYVAYDRLTGKGVRIRRPANAISQDGKRERPFGNDLAELRALGVELVETEMFGEQSTEVWRLTDRATRRKLWVNARDPKLPLRLETFVRGGGETITTDYSNWSRGLEISDRFFEPEAGLALDTLDYTTFLTQPPESARGIVLYPEFLHGPTPH